MVAEEAMESAVDHLNRELTKIRTGKASPAMLSGIQVEYYGAMTPISQVSNIGTADAKTLSIQPWEKSMLAPIEQAIFAANLGLTPMNDGETIRIVIPPLTEDRRRDLVKQAKSLAEDAKISLRSARHKIMDAIKKEIKNGFPEDAGKREEESVTKMLNSYSDKVDKVVKAKETDILTV